MLTQDQIDKLTVIAERNGFDRGWFIGFAESLYIATVNVTEILEKFKPLLEEIKPIVKEAERIKPKPCFMGGKYVRNDWLSQKTKGKY